MKKLLYMVVFALLATMFASCATAEDVVYTQSPVLDESVASGTLPPVAERLPLEPKLVHEVLDEDLDYQIGNYGGTCTLDTTSVNWSSSVFVGCNEALLCMLSTNSGEITGNILKGYDVNEDATVFTFYMREGLKWSDGEPVTIEDVMFTYENVLLNSELTPVLSANLRSGGKADGTPLVIEPVDDWSFEVRFDSSYGGFLVYSSIKGWVGYTDMLKPAHYLKQFHIDYAEECHGSLEAYYEFIQPFATIMGFDDATEEGVWVYVFNEIDMTNWENTNPTIALGSERFKGLIETNFPVLYPYIMESTNSGNMTFVRNPYYFKVDAAGQQLPYFDVVEAKYLETSELRLVETLAGNLTLCEHFFTDYSLLLEQQEKAGYDVYIRAFHNTIPSIVLNATYGLNIDGTVKDDEASKAWQDVIGDVRFRKALTLAIDVDELNDTICLGFASANEYYDCSHDIETANALLDEMGMKDIDNDGYRETPNGYKFSVQIWSYPQYDDYLRASELYVDYWREIGLNIVGYSTDSTLYDASKNANEIPMTCVLVHGGELWHQLDWRFGFWDTLWNKWVEAGGLEGKVDDSSNEYLKPSDEYIALRKRVQDLMTETPDVAANEILPEIEAKVAGDMFVIIPIVDQSCIIVADSKIANMPEGLGFTCWSALEYLFFEAE